MKYFLRKIVRTDYSYFEIEETRYNKILEAQQNLLEIQFIEEKFDSLVENYLELEDALSQITSRSMVLSNRTRQTFNNERSLVNRRIINLLTSARGFIEQSRHHFSKIFRNDPSKNKELEQVFSRQYDNLLEYRAMEAIRNYVQHRDSPVHSISHFKGVKNEEGLKKYMHETHIYIQISHLKEDGDFKKSILAELEERASLEKAEQKIDLRLFIRGYVEGIWGVQQWIRSQLFKSIVDWETTFENSKTAFLGAHPGENSSGMAVVKVSDPFVIEEEEYLINDLLDFRRFLEKKNANLSNLRIHYFTNQ